MGVPENEPAEEFVQKTIENVGANVHFNAIQKIHRLGRESPNKARPIIMRFLNIKDKNELVNAVIKKNKDLNTKITVREHLTIKRQKMFSTALTWRFHRKINSVYTRDGILNIQIRDGNYIKIQNEREFNDFQIKHNL